MTPSPEKLDSWLRCLGREIGRRMHDNVKLISEGKMNPEEAFRERRAMEEIYEYLNDQRHLKGEL